MGPRSPCSHGSSIGSACTHQLAGPLVFWSGALVVSRVGLPCPARPCLREEGPPGCSHASPAAAAPATGALPLRRESARLPRQYPVQVHVVIYAARSKDETEGSDSTGDQVAGIRARVEQLGGRTVES